MILINWNNYKSIEDLQHVEIALYNIVPAYNAVMKNDRDGGIICVHFVVVEIMYNLNANNKHI